MGMRILMFVTSLIIWLLVLIVRHFIFHMESEVAQSVLGYRLDGRGLIPSKGKVFLFSISNQTVFETHPVSSSVGTRARS
jgi:hypothetical protein